jgi:membrane fusion protein (multidrug efflux system)
MNQETRQARSCGAAGSRDDSFVAFMLACTLLFGTAGCGGRGTEHAEAARPPTAVTVLSVTPRDVPVSSEYIAQVQSSRQVNIQARVNGFLERRVYTEGAVVNEGDVLFLMDQKPFQVQLDAAVAALKRQEASLEVARANLARTKPLAAANALSKKDLDNATGAFLSAQASVEQAKASVEQAKLNLSYTTITSPVTGVTGAAEQADGTYLNQQNSRLTTVSVLSPTWVNFSVSENELQTLRDQVAKGLLRAPGKGGYLVEIILVDGSVFPHTGRITFADFQFNQQTGMFLVRVSVDNPDGLLRPNQYVHVRLHGAVRPNAILVPQRAVQQGSKGHFVWIVDKDGKADYRPVQIGNARGNDWFIFEGLHAGDQVVVDGAITLRPGEAVKATPLAEKAGT